MYVPEKGVEIISNWPNRSFITAKQLLGSWPLWYRRGVFHGGGLSNDRIQQRLSWQKIFAVIRLISQILIEFLLAKENFLPWNEKPYGFGRSAIKLSSELMLTEAIFYQPGTFFSILSEQGKSENLHTVLLVMWFVEVVFLLPLTITVDSTFVAGHATRNTATELLFYVLRAAGAKDVTQEHQRISWGQPEGSAVKKNGREGIRERKLYGQSWSGIR